MNPELRTFIETLVLEAHGEGLAEDIKETMIADLYPRLEQALSLAMLAKLTPEQMAKVEAMALDEVPQEHIQMYLMETIPDHSVVLQEALREFWAMYVMPDSTTEKTR